VVREKIKKSLQILENKTIEKIKNYYNTKDYNKFKGVIDLAVTNPSRLMRCPNTYNYKDENPVFNKIIGFYSLGEEDIQKNTNYIKSIKITPPKHDKPHLMRYSLLSISGNSFFHRLLKTPNLWSSLKLEWEKADERYIIFVKNLGAFVKHKPEYKDLAYNFLEYMGYKKRETQYRHLFEKDEKIIDVNLFELKHWAEKYELEHFLKLLNLNSIIYKGDNLKIEYISDFNVYNVYYKKPVGRGENITYIWEIYGGFKEIKKTKRIVYHVNSIIEKEEQIIVKIVNISKKDEENVTEFNLNNSEYIAIGKFIKFGNQKDQVLADSYSEFFKWILNLDIEEDFYTDCYGVFGEDLILLPNKFELLNENMTPECQSFINFHKENNTKINNEKVTEVGSLLREYLAYSKYSQIIFAYSLISPFRYYLMSNGLKEFGFLGFRGKSGIGKTTRIKILCNLFHSNYNSEGHSEDLLQSLFRFSSLQYILTPLVLDDPQNIDKRIISVLKELGTSKVIDTFKGTSSQKLKFYKFLRPIVLSFNNLTIKDSALINRFIFLDYTDEGETTPKEKLILDLEDKIYIIGKFFWENISHFINFVGNIDFDKSRINSKVTILNLGFSIMNELFRMLKVKGIEYFSVADYLSSGEEYIYNEKDEFLYLLTENLKNLTKTSIRFDDTVSEYNVFDLNPQNYTGVKFEPLYDKCQNYGIYLTKKGGLIITKKTLNYLNVKGYKIKKLLDITSYLDSDVYEYGVFRALGENRAMRGIILKTQTSETTPKPEPKDSKDSVLEVEYLDVEV